jgi:Ca2+/Na+ antiporter
LLYISEPVVNTLADTMVEHWDLFGWGRYLLLIGAVLLYVASRAGVDALGSGGMSPGRRAVGEWIPIAAAALVAIAFRRADLAISIVFATSVGAISLLMGSMSIVSPDSETPPAFRRLWLFTLPAALLVLLVGFAGHFAWQQALLLLIEGAALFFAWNELSAAGDAGLSVGEVGVAPKPRSGIRKLPAINLMLCVCLAVVGAVAGILGAEHISRDLPQISDMASVVAVLAPLLVLPMLTGGAALAQKKRAWVATTSGVGVVLLNLCLLLPALILLWYPANCVHWIGPEFWHLKLSPIWDVTPMPFAWVTWRLDNVVLVLLSFVLVPASLGRWRLQRTEGLTLIVLYGVYVLMEAAGSMRS